MSRDLEKIKLDIINLKEALEKISSTVGDIQKKIDKIDDNIQQSSPTSIISDQVRDQIQQFISANPVSTASVAPLHPSDLDIDFLQLTPSNLQVSLTRSMQIPLKFLQIQRKFCISIKISTKKLRTFTSNSAHLDIKMDL